MRRWAKLLVAASVALVGSPRCARAADSDWFGRYQTGAGTANYALILAADGSFRFELRGCFGIVSVLRKGAYRIQYRVLVLSAGGTDEKLLWGFGNRFRLVKWGDRNYVISEDKIREFCDAIARRWEPRNAAKGSLDAFLREDDEGKSASGFPDLPAQWLYYLVTDAGQEDRGPGCLAPQPT